MGLVAPRHVGSSQTRARTRVPCIGRQILNHCATREALCLSFFICKMVLTIPTYLIGLFGDFGGRIYVKHVEQHKHMHWALIIIFCIAHFYPSSSNGEKGYLSFISWSLLKLGTY